MYLDIIENRAESFAMTRPHFHKYQWGNIYILRFFDFAENPVMCCISPSLIK